MGTAANLDDWEPVAQAPAPIKQALLGQESGNDPNAPPSVDGAIGKAQIEPDTFSQYALPSEKIDNPKDYDAVYNRIVDHLYAKSDGDPARTAVGYFSGSGNIAPSGSSTPWKNNTKDGNGKSVASYVGDISDRLNTPPATVINKTEPMSQVTTQPDLSDWEPVDNAPMTQDEQAAAVAKLPWWGRALVDVAKNPEDASIGVLTKHIAGSVGNQMMEGAGDLSDLLTGDSFEGNKDSQATFNEKVKNGTATSADYKDAFLQGEANNPGGKAMGAARIVPGVAMASAAFNELINPALEAVISALGGDKPDIPLAENAFAFLGAKAPKKSVVPDSVSNFFSKISDKAGAAMNDAAGLPPAETGALPASMSKTPEGQPLLVSNTGAQQGVNNFAKFAQTDGIDLNKTADDLEEMQKTNPQARALDAMTKSDNEIPTGSNIFGLAKSIAQSPGQGRTMLAQMTGRGQAAAARIGSAFDDAISDKPYAQMKADGQQEMDEQAPLYKQAFAANKSMMTPTINRLLMSPAGKQAMGKAVETMQNNGQLVGVSNPDLVEQAALTGTDIPKDGIASGLKMQTLHNVKKALWDLSQSPGNRDSITGKYSENGRGILGQYHTLNGELNANDATRTPNQPNSGAYAQANKAYSNGARISDAVDMGTKFTTMRPEDINKYLSDDNISDPEKASFLSGVRDQLQTIADRKGIGQNPIASFNKIGLQKRLQAVAGNNAPHLSDVLANEIHMSKNDSLMGGSPTAANLAFGKEPAPPHTLPGRIAGEVPVVGGLLGYGIDKALAKTTANMSADSKAVIARILASKNPAELRALAGNPIAKKANGK
jgi:hypothetical protein